MPGLLQLSEAVWDGRDYLPGEAARIAASRVNTRSDIICGDSDARRPLKPPPNAPAKAVLSDSLRFCLKQVNPPHLYTGGAQGPWQLPTSHYHWLGQYACCRLRLELHRPKRLREVLRYGAPPGQLVARIERRHGRRTASARRPGAR